MLSTIQENIKKITQFPTLSTKLALYTNGGIKCPGLESLVAHLWHPSKSGDKALFLISEFP